MRKIVLFVSVIMFIAMFPSVESSAEAKHGTLEDFKLEGLDCSEDCVVDIKNAENGDLFVLKGKKVLLFDENLTKQWEYTVSQDIVPLLEQFSIDQNGNAFLPYANHSTFTGGFMKINQNGKQEWDYTTELIPGKPVIDENDVIYVKTGEYKWEMSGKASTSPLYAVEASGDLLWKKDIKGDGYADPISYHSDTNTLVIPASNEVIFLSTQGEIKGTKSDEVGVALPLKPVFQTKGYMFISKSNGSIFGIDMGNYNAILFSEGEHDIIKEVENNMFLSQNGQWTLYDSNLNKVWTVSSVKDIGWVEDVVIDGDFIYILGENSKILTIVKQNGNVLRETTSLFQLSNLATYNDGLIGTRDVFKPSRNVDPTKLAATPFKLGLTSSSWKEWGQDLAFEEGEPITVQFSNNIDPGFIKHANVFIQDANGINMDFNTTVKENKLMITPLMNEISKSSAYTLYLQELQSKNGTPLSEPIKLNFTVNER